MLLQRNCLAVPVTYPPDTITCLPYTKPFQPDICGRKHVYVRDVDEAGYSSHGSMHSSQRMARFSNTVLVMFITTETFLLFQPTFSPKGLQGTLIEAHLKYVTRFAKTRHNSACINFQYKAIVKLSAKNVFHKNNCSVFIGP